MTTDPRPPAMPSVFLEHRGRRIYAWAPVAPPNSPLYATDFRRRPEYIVNLRELPCYQPAADSPEDHRRLLRIAIEADLLPFPPCQSGDWVERLRFTMPLRTVEATTDALTKRDLRLAEAGVWPAKYPAGKDEEDGGAFVRIYHGSEQELSEELDAVRGNGYSEDFVELYLAARAAGAEWLLISHLAPEVRPLLGSARADR